MKADLHLHSRFSDRSADWLFRRFNFPDSYSQPRALYDTLRERGMDLITLTDHNTIDGGLENRRLARCVPERGSHRLFPGRPLQNPSPRPGNLTEAQHRDIAGLRENILDLQAYLAQQSLPHAVAHPLYPINQKLDIGHVERLILLFRCFEGLNGLRENLFNVTLQHVLAGLTPEKIERFAERHRLAPTHPEAWQKSPLRRQR